MYVEQDLFIASVSWIIVNLLIYYLFSQAELTCTEWPNSNIFNFIASAKVWVAVWSLLNNDWSC
jgi:hypothetical protein